LLRIKTKYIVQTIIVVLIIFLLIFLFKSQEEPIRRSTIKSKKIEVNGSLISGYTNGKINWQIAADYVWAGRSKFLFRGENITTGKLYGTDEQLILDALKANYVKANSKSKTLSANGAISGYFIQTKDRDTGAAGSKKYSSVKANELRYYRMSKRMYLRQDVVINKNKAKITVNRQAEVDCEKNITTLADGFVMESEDIVVSADRMVMYINDDYAEISGHVSGQRKPEENEAVADYDEREILLRAKPTYLYCDFLKHTTQNDNDLVEASGNIRVQQEEKIISANNGLYDKNQKLFHVWGDIEFTTDTLDWLVDKTRKNQFQNQQLADALKQTTKIVCDRIRFDAQKRELVLAGNVLLKQKDYKISCRRVEFDDRASLIKLMGAVKIENLKDGQTIKCNSIEIDIQNESFKADEQTHIDFEVDK
jgi:lipopolysaccharide assembly outer membrane protein LptD (OstA)